MDHEGSDARAFCAGIAKLEAKKAAAVRRDEIDRQLAKLDAKDVEAPPAAVESYVANMAALSACSAIRWTIRRRS